jgi:oxygen-independent coproporphyrinogen III oxidase
VTAAYVHIPFCVRKCRYCDFISYSGRTPDQKQEYVRALLREIAQAALWADSRPGSRPERLPTVFVGGGTPTVLHPVQLAAILTALDRGFGLDPAGEFTLEANPGTVDGRSLQDIRRSGFNRISFGLQAIQPHLLQILGRIHRKEDFQTGVGDAVQAGFRSINADIMFGLPEQTLDDVAETLQFLLKLPVNHISFYSLSLEEGTPLHRQCAADPQLLPDEQTERAQYHLIRQTLQQAGFEHYEISNAARPGHRCRHNLVYWTGKPYYGFGAAAHSFLQGIRRSNPASLEEYLSRFMAEPEGEANGKAGAESPAAGQSRLNFPAGKIEEVIDDDAAKKETMLLGLRLLAGVRYADFAGRHGCDLRACFAEPIGRLIRRNLLAADSEGVRLTLAGLDLANQVFCEFV